MVCGRRPLAESTFDEAALNVVGVGTGAVVYKRIHRVFSARNEGEYEQRNRQERYDGDLVIHKGLVCGIWVDCLRQATGVAPLYRADKIDEPFFLPGSPTLKESTCARDEPSIRFL